VATDAFGTRYWCVEDEQGLIPFSPKHVATQREAAEEAVRLYRYWRSEEFSSATAPLLRGKDLMCWCPLLDEDGNRFPCHADALLELANAELEG